MFWYVVQTLSGRGKEMLGLLRARDTDHVIKESFVPRRELMRKQKGEWVKYSDTLFPGYVFVRTDAPGAVNEIAGKLPIFARVLGSEKGFTPLNDHEELFITRVAGPDTHMVKMSTGVIEGDTVTVLQGPLRGYEGFITKIDRHKRLAHLHMEMLGRLVTIKLGLEIIRKS
ncbi:MAG: antiterminator LoaP [Eggerthellaceae bacterium]|nr:antiterminator LoaP [Eggerthellaceae bacterium]